MGLRSIWPVVTRDLNWRADWCKLYLAWPCCTSRQYYCITQLNCMYIHMCKYIWNVKSLYTDLTDALNPQAARQIITISLCIQNLSTFEIVYKNIEYILIQKMYMNMQTCICMKLLSINVTCNWYQMHIFLWRVHSQNMIIFFSIFKFSRSSHISSPWRAWDVQFLFHFISVLGSHSGYLLLYWTTVSFSSVLIS